MGVRLRSDFTSMDGIGYRIDIIDTEFKGTLTEFTTGMDSNDGFTLSYEGDNQERWNPIISSNVVINMAVETALLDVFINDLIGQPEARFYLDIRKKTSDVPVNYSRIWFGEIATDLITIEDRQRPYLFQITAFDNFAKLKYTPHSLIKATNYTFIDLLLHAISKLNYYDQLGSGFILKTFVDWYVSKMYTSASPAVSLDPLKQSKVNADAFIIVDNNNNQINMSIWDMLEQICLRWGARFLVADGMFHFIQVNIDDPTAMEFRRYTKTQAVASASEDKTAIGTDILRTEGTFSFLPILGKVSVNYKYKQSVYQGNLLPNQSVYNNVSFGTIQGGEGEQLVFNGTIEVSFGFGIHTPPPDPMYWLFDMKIQVGSYYLTNKNGYLQWTTIASERYEIVGGPFFNQSDYTRIIPVGFTTPPIPTTGAGVFDLTLNSIQSPLGTNYTILSGMTTSVNAIGFILRVLFEGSLDEGTAQFTAENDEYPESKYNNNITLPDLVTGDPFYSYDVGRLIVYNPSTSSWENADKDWSVGGAGTGININDLLAFELLAGQTKACRMFTGGIWSTVLDATKIISIDGNNYSFRGGSFNANFGRWDGEWVRLFLNRSNITGGGGGVGTEKGIDNYITMISNSAAFQSAVQAAVAQAAAEAARNQALLYEGEAGDQAALALTYKTAALAAQAAAEAAQAAAEDAQTECEAIRDSL